MTIRASLLAVALAPSVVACGASDGLRQPPSFESPIVDAAAPDSVVDAGLDATVVDAGPDAASILRSTARARVQGSVTTYSSSFDVVMWDDPNVSSFQTLPENLSIRRAIWEFDANALVPPDGFVLLAARLRITSRHVALVDLLAQGADGVVTVTDFDRAATLIGRIEGTAGDDGTTWTFDATSSVGAAIASRAPLGIRAQLSLETFGGQGTNDGMTVDTLLLELDYVPAP